MIPPSRIDAIEAFRVKFGESSLQVLNEIWHLQKKKNI